MVLSTHMQLVVVAFIVYLSRRLLIFMLRSYTILFFLISSTLTKQSLFCIQFILFLFAMMLMNFDSHGSILLF